MSAKERLKTWLKDNGITEAEFEGKVGLASGAVSNFGNSPRKNTIDKIMSAYPKLNMAWLLGISQDSSNPQEQDFEIKDDTVVYHYTTLKNFMGIIGDGMLRFFPLKNSNDVRDSGNNSEYKYISFCLGDEKQGYDKPRMWSQYGVDYEGICIGFYLNKLLKYNKEVVDLEHFRIEYLCSDEIRFLGNSGKNALKIKHKDWKQENEYRFISKQMSGLKFSYDCIYCVCAGINIIEKALLVRVGLNSKIKPMMLVSGVLRDGFLSVSQDVEYERKGNITIGKITTKEDLDEETGRANAKRFYEQLCATDKTERNSNYTYYDSYVDGAIPLYKDLPVSAGQQDLALIQASEKPSGWIKPSEVLTAIGAFPVIGCSMEPFIHQGDFITVAPVEKWDRVDPDKVYMIITSYDRMIKHLVPDEENDEIIWGISPNYPRVKILKNEIKAVFRVTFHGKLM